MIRHTLRTTLLVAAAIAIATGCASTATTSKAKPAPKVPGKPAAPQLLLVGTAAKAPPWLQAPCPGKFCDHSNPTSGALVAAGGKVSVVRMSATKTLFGYHADHGVVGALVWPGAGAGKVLWMRIVAGDRLLATDADGQLWTAASVEAARKAEGWSKVSGVPAKVELAAAGEWLVYGTESHVFVARWPAGADAPGRFKKSRPQKGAQVIAVAVRPDGVVAATARKTAGGGKKGVTHTTWLRGAGKKRWTKSAFQPRRIESDGQWIWNGMGSCAEVLAADGTTWLAPTKNRFGFSGSFDSPRRSMKNRARQAARARSYLSVLPANTRFDVASPDAAKHSRYIATGRSRCHFSNTILGMLGGTSGGCKAARCLGGTRGNGPKGRPFFLALFGDGLCDGAKCVKDGPLKRPPTVALGDRTTGAVKRAQLPKGCYPERLDTVGGLALLICRQKDNQPANIYTMASNNPGKWHFEGRLTGPPKAHQTLGADGTIVMHMFCPQDGGFGSLGGLILGGKGLTGRSKPLPRPKEPPCSVWVRKPVPAGTPDAWRVVSTPRAIAYRAGLGGHVLAIRVDKKTPQAVEVVVVPPEGATTTATFTTAPRVDTLWVLADGSIRFTDWVAKDGSKKKERRSRSLYRDGNLR